MSRKFHGLFHPLLSGDWPSLILSLDNRACWFKTIPPLRDGKNVMIPRLRSLASLKDLASFGLVISNEKPTDSCEDYLAMLAEFKIIKFRILGEIMGILTKEDLCTRYRYIIRSVPELNECGMMRPAYIQLLFHTREEAAVMMKDIIE